MRRIRLNRYEMMWMMVLFDLPVVKRKERKQAAQFRNFLLDDGFDMVQYSCYMRLLSGKDSADSHLKSVEANLPENGKVDIIMITDKQYSNIISFRGQKEEPKKKNDATQLLLF